MTARRALILLDHGSRRSGADRYLQALASAIRGRREDLAVHVAHLEIAPPDLAAVLAEIAAAGLRHASVYPFFLAPGNHLERDVPEQLARGRAAHPELRIELLAPLGASPELVDLVLHSCEVNPADARPDPERAPPDSGNPSDRTRRGTPL
jgi:sirohydrochlorin ferrochelatase